MPKEENKVGFLGDFHKRQWLYGVLAAILALLAVYGLVTIEQQEMILAIIMAVLNLGGSAGFILANRNSRPSKLDEEKNPEIEDGFEYPH